MLSPVRAEVFNFASPLITIPSSAIFSPCFITIISPIFTSSGFTFNTSFPFFRFAYSGFISIKFPIDFLELLTAISSSILPISYNNITINPSCTLFVKYAPIHDIVTKKFSFIVFDLYSNLMEFEIVLNNNIKYPKIIKIFEISFLKTSIPKIDGIVPIINLITSKITLLFFSVSVSSNTFTLGSTDFTIDETVFFTSFSIDVSTVSIRFGKLTVAFSILESLFNFASILFAQFAQSKLFNLYLYLIYMFTSYLKYFFYMIIS